MSLPEGLEVVDGRVVIVDHSLVTNLTVLDLSELFLVNKITEVGGLSTLTNLTILDLSHNQITQVGGLSTLTELTTLYLNRNPLLNIRYLPKSNKTLTIYINEDHKSLLKHSFLSLHNKHRFTVSDSIEPLLARKRKWVTMLAIVIKNPNYANYIILSETLELTAHTAKNILQLLTHK